MIAWIEKSTYQELFEKWKTEPLGSPWFRGLVGLRFTQALDRTETRDTVQSHTKKPQRGKKKDVHT